MGLSGRRLEAPERHLEGISEASWNHLEATERHLVGWRQLGDTSGSCWGHIQEPAVAKLRLVFLCGGDVGFGAANHSS